MKIFLSASTLLTATLSFAGLQPLDNEALQQAQGQGGADLSLVLSLNHGINVDGTSTNTISNFCQINYEQCRLALSLNNRYSNGDYIDRVTGKAYTKNGVEIVSGKPTGDKLWLVFKGMQGTINLQKVGLDGADLTYTQKNSSSIIVKPAIQLSYDPTLPILIRNYGFASLAIEQDSGNIPGYWLGSARTDSSGLDIPAYNGGSGLKKFTNGKYDYSSGAPSGYGTSSFDHGREIGFTGLNMNGNLALAGTVKIFGCDGSHPRC